MDIKSINGDGIVRVTRVIAFAALSLFVVAIVFNVFDGRMGGVRKDRYDQSLQNGRVQKGGMMTDAEAPLSMPSRSGGVAVESFSASDEALAADAVQTTEDKKVVKVGSLDLRVGSIENAVNDLRRIADELGGEVFSSSVYDAGNVVNNAKNGLVTLKVPAVKFDEALGNIKSIASVVVSESVSGQDVTSEYVDLQARLKNKQTEESAIADILTRDTNKIDDVLRVTIELSRVRGEIERLQAQINALNNQVDMSTITVSLTEDARIGSADTVWRPGQEAKDAVNALIKAFQKLINFLISFVIVIVPILLLVFLIFGGLIYFVVKKLYKWLNR